MAKSRKVISSHFPYLPIRVTLKQSDHNLEALLDTGFDGLIALPPQLATNGYLPIWYVDCKLANDEIIKIPASRCSVKLDRKKFNDVELLIMGDEPIIGRGISNHFKIILDHGKRVIVE